MEQVITGNKILSHLDRIAIARTPITADVFLNNYCNNNCPYCTYRRWELDDGARFMPYGDFVRYAKRMKKLGVLGIILTGGGEPTISRDFDKITQWLEDHKFPYGINTNFNRYVLCRPRYLKVSLDGWDEDSYEKSRGVRNYGMVRDNIIRYAAEKPLETNLGIQLLAKHVDDVYRFWESNKDLPVDYIVIRPVESTNGKYYKHTAIDNVPGTQPGEIIEAIKQVAEIDDRVVLNYKWNMLGMSFSSCIGQWSQLAVNEVGQVMYCCHKPYQIVGHIMDDDILWKKAAALNDMQMCDVPCRLTGVNKDLQTLENKAKDFEFI